MRRRVNIGRAERRRAVRLRLWRAVWTLPVCALALALASCGGQQASSSGQRTSMGPQGLPYMETGTPSGTLAGRPAVGAVILIHGGGWQDTGPTLLPPMTPIAQHFNMLGWDTFNTDYRPEAKSLPDVIRVYDYVRSQVGPRKPICALGSSAGGNLALLLAIARPKLACVMSYAGPTDLTVLDNAGAGDVFQLVHKLSSAVRGDLAAWSPLKQASKIRAKALLAYATNDPLVPLSQATDLAARLPGSVLSVLQPGSRIFIHSLVKSSQLDHTYAIQDNLLARVAAAHR